MPESIPDFDLYAELGVRARRRRRRHPRRPSRRRPPGASRLSRADDADDDAGQAAERGPRLADRPRAPRRYDESRGLGAWDRRMARADGSGGPGDADPPRPALATEPGRRDAIALLEVGWWLLLIVAAALIFAMLLLIVADR